MTDPSRDSLTEAVGLFHSARDMEAAIDDLLTQGFDRSDLSLMASEDAVAEKLHETYASVRELEDRADVPTTAYIPRETLGTIGGTVIGTLLYVPAMLGLTTVVASGGALAAAIAAMAIYGGVGATLGTILAALIGRTQSDLIAAHLERGGLLLWVRTRDARRQERALAIMRGHAAEDVHVHTLPSIASAGGVPVEEIRDASCSNSD